MKFYFQFVFTLLLCCFLESTYSQTSFYIDPTAAPGGNGSLAAPYDSISRVEWRSNATYYIKRGTVVREVIQLDSSNIILDAYGEGERPSIHVEGGKRVHAVRVFGDDCELRNLKISTTDHTVGSLVGFKACRNGLVYNCEIFSADVGLATYYVAGTFRLLSSIVHTIGQDAVYLSNHDSVLIDSCYVYDANLSYNDGIYGKGNGDGIQTNNIDFTRITNTIVDREGTNNKFSIILQSSNEIEMENCILYGSDLIFDDFSLEHDIGMYTLYLSGVSKGTIRNCKFYSGVNNVWNQYSSNITLDACEFYFPMNNCIDGAVNNMHVTNCYFHQAGYSSVVSGWSGPVGLTMHNNIFYDDFPIAGSGDAIRAYDNLYYPLWHKTGLYDTNPIEGFSGNNYEVILGDDILKYTVINRRDSMQKYVYVDDRDFYEVYYLNDFEREDVKLFFDVNTKSFVAMPVNAAVYSLSFKAKDGDVLYDGSGLSEIAQVSTRGWNDSICLVSLKSVSNSKDYSRELHRVDSLYYPKNMVVAEIETVPSPYSVYYDAATQNLHVRIANFDEIPVVLFLYNLQGYLMGTYKVETDEAQFYIGHCKKGVYTGYILHDVGLARYPFKVVIN